jgi:hypothetical protein
VGTGICRELVAAGFRGRVGFLAVHRATAWRAPAGGSTIASGRLADELERLGIPQVGCVVITGNSCNSLGGINQSRAHIFE